MSKKDLLRTPRKMVRANESTRNDWWFYEDPGGLCVVRRGAGFATIPRKAIKEYIERLEK
jgi:hypothetical protein